ncbi:MAG: NUDIX hydrolase [Pyrinomonadaceae bacterium]
MTDTTDKAAPVMLASREIFKGRIFEVTTDTVREADKTYTRDVVRHVGGAGVVACFQDDTVALVRQYRHPTGSYVLEIPAGKLEEGERPEVTAARELEEELGVVAGRMEPLSDFYTTPGFCSERLWIFLATELTATAQRLEDDELIEVVRVPFKRALSMAWSGEIEDAKTIIGLMLAARLLKVGDAVMDD